MRAARFAILAGALIGALALGAVAYLLAPSAIALTAAVAVYAASLATAGFLVNGRQAVIDRSDLRAEVTLEPDWGGVNQNIQASVAGREGRQPAWYAIDAIAIVVRCMSPLGAEIVQQYRWYPNAHPQDQDITWQLRELQITLEKNDPNPIQLEWRD